MTQLYQYYEKRRDGHVFRPKPRGCPVKVFPKCHGPSEILRSGSHNAWAEENTIQADFCLKHTVHTVISETILPIICNLPFLNCSLTLFALSSELLPLEPIFLTAGKHPLIHIINKVQDGS